MGGRGLEQSSLMPSKTPISQTHSAKTGALKDKNDPDLAWLTEHWNRIPGPIRKQIIDIARSASPKGLKNKNRNI